MKPRGPGLPGKPADPGGPARPKIEAVIGDRNRHLVCVVSHINMCDTTHTKSTWLQMLRMLESQIVTRSSLKTRESIWSWLS